MEKADFFIRNVITLQPFSLPILFHQDNDFFFTLAAILEFKFSLVCVYFGLLAIFFDFNHPVGSRLYIVSHLDFTVLFLDFSTVG